MSAEGTQSDGITFETALYAACKELNARLKANPGCKPNIAAAAHCHSLNYSTLHNRFQGHTNPRKAVHGCQQNISLKEETILTAWIEHLGQTVFASVPSKHMSSLYVTRNQAEAESITFLDDTHRSSYQSHQDLIPNMLRPLIDHLFRTISTSLRKSLTILVFPLRTYIIWMRRVVRGGGKNSTT